MERYVLLKILWVFLLWTKYIDYYCYKNIEFKLKDEEILPPADEYLMRVLEKLYR